MKARVHLRPSKWSALRPAVRAVLGKSLPRRVEAFYARHDGLTVSVGSGSEKATLFGLAELFGGLKRGAFRPHLQVTKKTVADLAWSDQPFYEVFFDESDDDVSLKTKLQDHEVAWGPSGLFVGNHSGTLRRLDATTLEETFTATMPPFVRTMRAVSEGLVVSTEELDAGSMAVVGGSQAVHLLDATNGALRRSWDRGLRFAVSAGALAVTFGAEVKVFDLPSCAERWAVKAPEKDGFNHLAFSADGSELVCTHRFDDDWGRSPSHLLRVDAKTGASRGAWPMGQRPGDERFGQVVDALAMSPGGALAVATSPVGVHWWRL